MLMFDNDYAIVWIIYLIGAVGCLAVWFRLTRWMWRLLREPLRLALAVLLLTPTIVDPDRSLYAPALATAVFEAAFKLGNNALHAIPDLALYALIGFSLYLLFALARWFFERNREQQIEQQRAEERLQDQRTLRERMQSIAREDARLDSSAGAGSRA
ncbi:MFS transporter [Azomonas macrocytogenes]|uniref:Signal transduction histidine kinase n=1 Tax=Azomonas macrocytogenes TaxID=69962 RepID=A0A839T9G7_AZOMA|nr:MFS transporter [Azomonas macrocytogenes]MBB3104854.1 signal transduction histidine kinase [Azomonas macrocytogenes]